MKRFLLLILMAFTFISCSDDKQHISQNINDKVQNMSDSDIVNELIIKTEGDNEQLGRILDCSIYTLNRIKNKETYLTENSRKEFRDLLLDIEFNGVQVLKERDPYYDSWVRSFRIWLNAYIFWILGISLVISLVLFPSTDGVSFFLFLIVIILIALSYLITWIGNMVSPYENPSFLFIEEINPIFETLV